MTSLLVITGGAVVNALAFSDTKFFQQAHGSWCRGTQKT